MKIKNLKKGFTLIELLVVISIIALLSSIVLSALNDARAKARDAQRHQDIKQIQNALELYRSQYGEYPKIGSSMANSSNSTFISNWTVTLNNALVVNNKFISKLPTDPKPSSAFYLPSSDLQAYGYAYTSIEAGTLNPSGCSSGQYYVLLYRLEKNKTTNLGPGVAKCNNTGVYRPAAYTTGLVTTGMSQK